MPDIDKFHEWVETQSPLALREYTHAQAAWLARGELDAVRIKELEAKLDKVKRTVFLGKSLSEANERYLDELANECSDPNL